MKRFLTVLVLFFVLVALAPAQNFLRRAAYSNSDFWSMASSNPAKYNYESCFRTSISNLRSRWGYLSRVRLTRSTTYTMTFTNGRNWFYTRRVTLRSGSPVFLDAWNRVVLDASTGNPLR